MSSKLLQNANRLPKVVIDARMVTEIPHGIARYVGQIARGLREIGELPYLPVFLTQPQLKQELAAEIFGPFETATVQSPFLSSREWFEIPQTLRQINARLYHSPSFSSLWQCPCPSVVTIHDLNHLHFGSKSKKLYYQILLKRFAKRSAKVLTVSQFSQNEIAQWLGISLSQITVTYNAVQRSSNRSFNPLPQELQSKLTLPENLRNYFFCLSNPKPHKNLSLLIQAYQQYRKAHSDAWPLLLSTDPLTSPIDGVYYLGSLPHPAGETLLHHASGLLFPSIYEGFGLPPVEAAVLGVPLAVSDIPPHREGLCDLKPNEAHWVAPKSLSDWAEAFGVLQSQKISPTSVETQNQILNRLSSRNLGQAVDRIYRDVLKISQ